MIEMQLLFFHLGAISFALKDRPGFFTVAAVCEVLTVLGFLFYYSAYIDDFRHASLGIPLLMLPSFSSSFSSLFFSLSPLLTPISSPSPLYLLLLLLPLPSTYSSPLYSYPVSPPSPILTYSFHS